VEKNAQKPSVPVGLPSQETRVYRTTEPPTKTGKKPMNVGMISSGQEKT